MKERAMKKEIFRSTRNPTGGEGWYQKDFSVTLGTSEKQNMADI